jgi:hypothetical protein
LKGTRQWEKFEVPSKEDYEQVYKAIIDLVHELRAEEQSEG